MRALVVPEDPTYDQYILKPIVEKIFVDIGCAARVEILRDPHLRGAQQALDATVISAIIQDNQMVDIFVLIVDQDCGRQGNAAKARSREAEHADKLVVCLAVEEIEVWMLALHKSNLPESWTVIREECDPKELYAEPFLKQSGWTAMVGGGRKMAMRHLGQRWRAILSLCPEIAELKGRIERLVSKR